MLAESVRAYIAVAGLSIILLSCGLSYGQGFDHWESDSFGDRLGNWAFGTGVGVNANGPGGTRFAEVFTADRYLDKDKTFSIGPMIQLVPPGDYTMVAGAIVGRYWFSPGKKCNCTDWYNFPLKYLTFQPFLGLGGLHSSIRNSGPNNTTIQDTSYYAATGVSLNIHLPDERFGVSLTWMHNLHDIRTATGRDRESVSYFVGISFRPTN